MIYNKLKQVRYRNKMTAQQVSNKVGISKSFYCQIENCKRRLTYDTAVKIASVFNVKPDYLFYDDVFNVLNDKIEKN